MSLIENIPIVNAPYLSVNGFKISNDATTPNTKLNITSGIARDQFNINDINMGNFLGANPNVSADTVTVVDATVTGLNGLDKGSFAASTMYYVYTIADPVNFNPTGAIISTNAPSVGPLLPTGYSIWRHIGFAPTDGSIHFYAAYWSGNNGERLFTYNNGPTIVNAGTATSYTAVVLTGLVPAVDNIPVSVAIQLTPAAAGNIARIRSPNMTNAELLNYGQVTSVVNYVVGPALSQLVTGAPNLFYSTSAGTVSVFLSNFSYFL